ncbi:MAG: hypothetical protein KGL39_39185 [Patescibacteria group bacterium]|nr:hypothetical protein [Patescibacteria group bacterium]
MSTLSAGLIIALLVALIKPFIELAVPKDSSLHDGLIRAVAAVIGVVGEVANVTITHGGLTWILAWPAAGQGLIDSLTAVASYHLVTSSPGVLGLLGSKNKATPPAYPGIPPVSLTPDTRLADVPLPPMPPDPPRSAQEQSRTVAAILQQPVVLPPGTTTEQARAIAQTLSEKP